MKKIYVLAYYNMNLGDDLFIHMLADRYYDTELLICCNPQKTVGFYNKKNIHVISYIKWLLLKAKKRLLMNQKPIVDQSYIRKADAIIKIGGSIFIEYDGWSKNWIDTTKPLFIIGANYGPAKTKEYYNIAREKIASAEHCCFRDQQSYMLFSDLGNVGVAPDIIFGLNIRDIVKKNEHCKGIGISIIDLEHRIDLCEYMDDYVSSIAYLADYFISNSIPVTLLGFCQNEGDGKAIEDILVKCKHRDLVKTTIYNGDYIAFLEAMESCETIVATRFHAMILGWIMEKNVVPIIYSSKQRNVINDVNFNGYVFELPDIKKQAELLVAACQDKICPLDDISNLKEKASNQFEALDKFLQV